MTVNNKPDSTTNCAVSPKNKQLSPDNADIMISRFEFSNLSPAKDDRNYYYSRLSEFRFPNNKAKPASFEGALPGCPFKTTPTTSSSPQNTSSSPQNTSSACSNYSQSTPRYTPSSSFQSQCTTSSRKSSHKRSVAVSISSSSIDSIFSDISKPSSLDSGTRSRISSVESCSSIEHPTFSKKASLKTGVKTDKHIRIPPFEYHQCHASSLPLPLIDLDLAAKDPKPRILNSFLAKKHNAFNSFNENDIIVEDQVAEASLQSPHHGPIATETTSHQQCLAHDSDKPQIKGDSDEYVDLVDFLRETTVKETLDECEITVKSKFNKIKAEDDYNPFQYIQSDEKWFQSPLCTPTVSR